MCYFELHGFHPPFHGARADKVPMNELVKHGMVDIMSIFMLLHVVIVSER